MTLMYLVRHARTASNRNGRYMGWIDEQVEPAAVGTATVVADRLAMKGISRIYSSPLRRARQTAEPLANRMKLDVEVRADLGELKMGSWEGMAQSVIAEQFPVEWAQWRTDPASLSLSGRETLTDFKDRVARCIDDIAARDEGRSVAIFSHDTVIRVAVIHVLDLPLTYYRRIEAANCAISVLEHGKIGKLRLDDPD